MYFQVIKMLVVVVLLFGICWLPLHVFILVLDFNPHLLDYQTAKQEQFFTALYYTVHWLAMSNSCVNPIVYGFLNDSFRVCFKDFIVFGQFDSIADILNFLVNNFQRTTLCLA